MDKILRQLVQEKATGSYIVKRDGTNSDKAVVESTALECGCELTDWCEHEGEDIVMDFSYDRCNDCSLQCFKSHFIIVACAGTEIKDYA